MCLSADRAVCAEARQQSGGTPPLPSWCGASGVMRRSAASIRAAPSLRHSGPFPSHSNPPVPASSGCAVEASRTPANAWRLHIADRETAGRSHRAGRGTLARASVPPTQARARTPGGLLFPIHGLPRPNPETRERSDRGSHSKALPTGPSPSRAEIGIRRVGACGRLPRISSSRNSRSTSVHLNARSSLRWQPVSSAATMIA